MLPEARRVLDEFFAPFNRLLAEELRDDRFLWRTPKTDPKADRPNETDESM